MAVGEEKWKGEERGEETGPGRAGLPGPGNPSPRAGMNGFCLFHLDLDVAAFDVGQEDEEGQVAVRIPEIQTFRGLFTEVLGKPLPQDGESLRKVWISGIRTAT
jgi:hypothetical protein